MAGTRSQKAKDEQFRAIVKAKRSLHNNMSQTVLARRVGCSQPRISVLMQDPEKLTLKQLRKLADALGFEESELRKII